VPFLFHPPHCIHRLHRSCIRALTVLTTLLGGLEHVQAANLPAILPSSFRITPGPTLRFQFQAPAAETDGFRIETAPSIGPNSIWTDETGSVVDPVAEGLFQATVPISGDTRFYRVRSMALAASGPALWINEVMSDNTSAFADETGAYWDWIELYNPNDTAVDLEGFTLSDTSAVQSPWRFPAVSIQPNAQMILFASDLNQATPGTALHTNFKLKASGERLVLRNPASQPIDEFTIPPLKSNQSVGRFPDGGSELFLFDQSDSSPGEPNRSQAAVPVRPRPTFAPDGGFFSEPVHVTIASEQSDLAVHFTLDGSMPTAQSPVITGPIHLEKTTLVRAITVSPGGATGEPGARTFFIGVTHRLPIVSLATAPANLEFQNGYLYGMSPRVLSRQGQVLQNYPYPGSNAWQDREVEVALEFFEPDGRAALRQRAGMKIFGGWGSRGYPQKSLALFARRTYGTGKFQHRIFPEEPIESFEALVLRNSGNDNQSTHQTPPRPPISEFGPTRSHGSYFVNSGFTLMRDAMMQRLIRETDLDTQAYRPAVIYINGEYWGIYNIREKMNEAYVLAHHGMEPGSVDLIEGYGSVRAGSVDTYSAMQRHLSTQNMADPDKFAFAEETYLDVDNFMDYQLSVIYFQNFDIGNIKCWRPRARRGRFQWMVFDQDYGFGLWPPAVYLPAMARDYADYDNMFRFSTAGTGTGTGWPNAGGRTLLLRSLLNNPQFKERFIRRAADLLNSLFREQTVEQTIAEMAAVIRPEISAHLQRWSWSELEQRGFGSPHQAEFSPFTRDTWENHVLDLLDFARHRPTKLRQDCLEHFGLTGGLGTLSVEVQPPGSGRVQVNSLTLKSAPWQGVYFADYATTLRPLPNPGQRFVGWTTATGNEPSHRLDLSLTRDTANHVIARFEPAAPAPAIPSELFITEIMYHPAAGSDSGDWVEIHNPGIAPVDLSGWVLRDADDAHAWLFPETTLAPGGYLVIHQDDARFRLFHPATLPAIGSFGFGLANSGDSVRLFRPNGTLACFVPYGDERAWPTGADGTGATLERIDLHSNAASPSSWRASSTMGGSPGRPWTPDAPVP
jgi:hypothetical protein